MVERKMLGKSSVERELALVTCGETVGECGGSPGQSQRFWEDRRCSRLPTGITVKSEAARGDSASASSTTRTPLSFSMVKYDGPGNSGDGLSYLLSE